MAKNILFTGVAGFVGSHTAEKLVAQGHTIVGIDNFLTGKKDNLSQLHKSGNFTFYEGDVNNRGVLEDVFSKQAIDVIFHYASIVGVERTLASPLAVLSDIEGVKNVCELAVKNNVERVLYASSSEVYGIAKEFPLHEEHSPLNSRLPYAAVKQFAEVTIEAFNEKYDLPYTIFRFFNTYGPRQSTDFVMSRFISQALSGEDVSVYGAGTQTRTFLYVDDNTDFTAHCMGCADAENQTYNLGSPDEISMNELADLVIKETGSKSKIAHINALEKGDMPRRVPDVQKMRSVYDKLLIDIEKGLKRTIEYFLDQK